MNGKSRKAAISTKINERIENISKMNIVKPCIIVNS